MLVMKFGGTSVGSAEMMKRVTGIVKSMLDKKPVVVVSAMSGVTNTLVKVTESLGNESAVNSLLTEIEKKHDAAIADLGIPKDAILQVLKEFKETASKYKVCTPESSDHILSFGERFSIRMVSAYMNSNGLKSRFFDAWDIGMITDDNFGEAEPLASSYKKIKSALQNVNEIPIIAGYIGKTSHGKVTTFGRGGSDYTGAIIGAAVDSEEIQIWTDVNGIMSCDPRIVKSAKTVPVMSFDEAAELAYFGARVLHPKTILPAVKKNIPVRVLNTFEPENPGTVILSKSDGRMAVKGIAAKKNITIINVDSKRMLDAHGFLAKVFEIFKENRKSVDMVSTSEVSISMTVDNDKNLDKILDELRLIADVTCEKNKAIICVVGEGMKHTPGIAARTFKVLGDNKINIEMITQGASEINISFVVKNEDAENAMKLLHREYFE